MTCDYYVRPLFENLDDPDVQAAARGITARERKTSRYATHAELLVAFLETAASFEQDVEITKPLGAPWEARCKALTLLANKAKRVGDPCDDFCLRLGNEAAYIQFGRRLAAVAGPQLLGNDTDGITHIIGEGAPTPKRSPTRSPKRK